MLMEKSLNRKAGQRKKKYIPPQLELYGDVTELTMGGTIEPSVCKPDSLCGPLAPCNPETPCEPAAYCIPDLPCSPKFGV